jgi:hypothetical protein
MRMGPSCEGLDLSFQNQRLRKRQGQPRGDFPIRREPDLVQPATLRDVLRLGQAKLHVSAMNELNVSLQHSILTLVAHTPGDGGPTSAAGHFKTGQSARRHFPTFPEPMWTMGRGKAFMDPGQVPISASAT